MKVLLTGATGFIGSYVLDELVRQNIEIAILVRPNSNTWRIQEHLNKCTIIEGSLNNLVEIEKQIIDYKPDTLIHTAWQGVANTHRNDAQQVTENISQAQSLFFLMNKAYAKTIIAIGSQAEYGPINQIIDESMPTNPTTMYGVAKLACYHLLKTLCLQNNIRFAWLRLFSAYGPKDNPCWLIPSVISKLMRNEDFELTAGTQLWDFIYAKDVAKAIVATALSNQAQGAFNLGSGTAQPIKATIKQLRDAIEPSQSLHFGTLPFRPDQVTHLQANIDRLQQHTDWKPTTSLQQGLQETIEWYKKFNKEVSS